MGSQRSEKESLKDNLNRFILLNDLSKMQDTWHTTWRSGGRSELSLRVEINLNTGGILCLDCVYSNECTLLRKLKGIDGGILGEEVNREEVIVRNILSTLFQCPSFLWVPKHLTLWGGKCFYLTYSLQYPNFGQIKEMYRTMFTSGLIYSCKLICSCAKTSFFFRFSLREVIGNL